MKAVPDYFPDWVERVTVPKRGGTVTHALANDAATLVYLAGQNVVTPHLWLSRADEPQQARPADHRLRSLEAAASPTCAPPRATPASGCATPGLATYAMVTGSRGIHVVCPLRRGPGFGDVHRFARAVAEEMVEDDPKRLTLEYKKVDRGSKIYVDVNRNAYAQHAVAPYGVRPRAAGAGGRAASTGTSCRTPSSSPTAGR